MMGSGRTRGWIIIGMDLLIVLVIYFLYSQFAFQSPDPKISSFENDFKYSLQVDHPSSDSIPITFSVSNNGNLTRSSELPNGVLLILTDGRNQKYWTKLLVTATTLRLDPNETRAWSVSAPEPESDPPYYVEVFLDENRQTRVKVP